MDKKIAYIFVGALAIIAIYAIAKDWLDKHTWGYWILAAISAAVVAYLIYLLIKFIKDWLNQN